MQDQFRAAIEDRAGPNEAAARESLDALRSVMDSLEDTEHFEAAHRALDAAGGLVRRVFGCLLTFEGGRYYQDCPVALAHVRGGFSIEAEAEEVECSICGRDPLECPHITGREYDGEVCARIITKARIERVALVGRPANPLARIRRESVPVSALREVLGGEWEPGIPVSCDRCLRECKGLTDELGGH